jgi:hypothetical protein
MTRRGIASALVLGVFLVSVPVSLILLEAVEARWGDYGVLLNPVLAANGAMLAVFGERPERGDILRQADLPPGAFAAAVALYGIVFAALLINRYRRLSA